MTILESLKQIRMALQFICDNLPDEQAAQVPGIYDEWTEGTDYAIEQRVRYADELYKVKTKHTSQSSWTPDISPTLFEKINVTNEGTQSDAIPYTGNMELEQGKYYIQNDVIYICTRSTGVPVYNALADLVKIYVEVAG